MSTRRKPKAQEEAAGTLLTDAQRNRLAAASRRYDSALDKARIAFERATAPAQRQEVKAIEAAKAAYDAEVAEIMEEVGESE